MRFFYVMIVGILLLESPVRADPPVSGEGEPDVRVTDARAFTTRMSYALGYDIYRHISGQVDLDTASFLEGIEDAGRGRPKLDPDQMRQLLSAYQRMARQAEADKLRAVRDQNLAEGGVFLEGNKLKAGVVSLSSGLQYKVIRQGDGPVPEPDDSVECHYRGRLINGTEFDSSYRRGRPAVFQVSKVIAGWAQALTRMPAGSKWELYVPADLAYGDQGAGEDIQPGQALIFEVELLGILGPHTAP